MKQPTLMAQTVVRRARGALCARVMRILLAGTVLVCAFAPPVATFAASKSKDKREIKAREAFAEGRYDEALDLFAKLYAEKLHPTYLRNIGRCYQNLQQPDKAINSFRDYLRQAKDVSPSERKEVDGYIAEMQDLKKKQDEQAARAAAPPPPPIPVPAAPPVEASQGTHAVSLTTTPAAPTPEASAPFYKRGWFWGVVGAVAVVAVAGALYGAGVFSHSSQCPSGSDCKNLGGH